MHPRGHLVRVPREGVSAHIPASWTRPWELLCSWGLPGPLAHAFGAGLGEEVMGSPCLPPCLNAYVWVFSAVSSMHSPRTPPASRVIKTRYRIVKKIAASPLSIAPFPVPLPSWRMRRLSLCR